MFQAYRPILGRIHTAVHATIGSVAVLFRPRALYVIQLFTQPLVQWLYHSGRVLCMTYRTRGLNGTATEPMVV
jgi:hypothetical protein